MPTRRIATNTIRARADNGNTYLLVEYTTQVSAVEDGVQTGWADGTTAWMLQIPGQKLRPADTEDGIQFQSLDGMTLTRID